jgi:ribosomal protein S18 acetylase RimI-like enzyme
MTIISETKDYKLISQLSEEIFNLHAGLYPEIFKPHNRAALEKNFERFFADPNCKCYVARQNGIEIGFAIFLIMEASEDDFLYGHKVLYIDQISVLSKYQKTGVGTLLMEQAEIIAKENSIKKITLEHWTANNTAAVYFRKKGFAPYRERLFKIID